MEEMKQSWLERAATPEEVGVNSVLLKEFIDKTVEQKKELHSLCLIRHGKIVCELYREPFSSKYKHMMYSVSKSFTSIAIGFAVEEGYLSVDTRFVDIFPETRSDKTDEYLEEMTIEDLLTMRSGKEVSIFLDRTKDRWFKDIMDSPWISEPGTEFLYISENMYLLCCVIHKLTGMSVVDYLMPRLFEPLGIDRPFWETCPSGIEAGGWGMMLSTEELAKFTYCCQQKGKFGGKQVIPEKWIEQASAYHAAVPDENGRADNKTGYGYCFWTYDDEDVRTYRADGMFSQYGIVFEQYDACVITTGGEINQQSVLELIWEYFPKVFVEENTGESVQLSLPAYEKLPEKPRSFLEKNIHAKKIRFSKPVIINLVGYPVSVVPLPALFMESDKAGNIDKVTLKFFENDMTMAWFEGDEFNTVKIGLDGEYRWDSVVLGKVPYTTCCTGCWNSENELEVHIRCIEVVAERIIKFKFNGDNVIMRPSSNPTVNVMAESLKESVKSVIKQPLVQSAVSKALPRVIPFVDAVQRGKIKVK